MKTDNKKIRIAVVDDNELYNHLLSTGLKHHISSLSSSSSLDIEIASYTNARSAYTEIDENIDIAFLDYYLSDTITGMDILKRIKKLNPNCEVVILSSIKNRKTSIETINAGANDFIYKDPHAITISCHKAVDVLHQKKQL